MKTMQNPLRVLMVFTIMNRGGAETMVMNYYRNIDRRKIQFDFMVHRMERGAYDDEIELLGGKIYRMMPLHPLTLKEYRKQINDFFNEHPEYSIVHGHCSELGYFVYKEAKKRKIPYILAHAHSSKVLLDYKWLFRIFLKKDMQKYITYRFACSEQAARWLFGHNHKSAILQKNAIDCGMFAYNEEQRMKQRRKLGMSDDCMVIGHVGSLTPIKNHVFLLRIFDKFHRMHPKSCLVLVGDGFLKEKLDKQIRLLNLQDHIYFLGDIDNVNEVLNMFDIFVFPSIGEGFSMATLEAQCNGIPCLVSDTLPEEVRITDLVSVLSLKECACKWADKILELKDRNSRCQRSDYGEQIIRAGYDIHFNAHWLQDYYLQL